MNVCKVCGDQTNSVFNIDFKAVPICERCAIAIFIQQAIWYSKQKIHIPKLKLIKVVGVIAYNIEDFQNWRKVKKHMPKFRDSMRIYDYRNTKYVALTMPEHSCGYLFDKLIETDRAHRNEQYPLIKKSAETALKLNIRKRYEKQN